MNTRITSSSATPATHHPSAQQATAQAVQSTSEVNNESTSAQTAPSEFVTADQSDVVQHADYSFSQAAVQFPDEVKSQPTYAGLGEIMGGIAALFSGAPSGAFSPVIEQAQKNLAERRAPQQEPVEVDTAASDKTLKD